MELLEFQWNYWKSIGITARWEISIISPSELLKWTCWLQMFSSFFTKCSPLVCCAACHLFCIGPFDVSTHTIHKHTLSLFIHSINLSHFCMVFLILGFYVAFQSMQLRDVCGENCIDWMAKKPKIRKTIQKWLKFIEWMKRERVCLCIVWVFTWKGPMQNTCMHLTGCAAVKGRAFSKERGKHL